MRFRSQGLIRSAMIHDLGGAKVKVRSVEESAAKYGRNTVRNSIEAFLEGGQGIDWVTGIIQRAGLPLKEAREMFISLQGYGDAARYQELSRWFDLQ